MRANRFPTAVFMVGVGSWFALGCGGEESEIRSCEAAAEHLAACGLPATKADEGDVCNGEFADELLNFSCEELLEATEVKAEGVDACLASDLCTNSFYFDEEVCDALGAACADEAKEDSGRCACKKNRKICLKHGKGKKRCGKDSKGCKEKCRTKQRKNGKGKRDRERGDHHKDKDDDKDHKDKDDDDNRIKVKLRVHKEDGAED